MPAIYQSIQVDTSMCQPDQSTGPPTIQQASQPASHPESQQPGNQSPNIRRGDRQLTANVAAGPRTAWQIRLASGIGMVIDPPCNRSANLHLRTTGSPVRRTPVTGLGLAMNCKQPDASSWDAGCMPPFFDCHRQPPRSERQGIHNHSEGSQKLRTANRISTAGSTIIRVDLPWWQGELSRWAAGRHGRYTGSRCLHSSAKSPRRSPLLYMHAYVCE